MNRQFYWLVVGLLGAWRITFLLHAEDGPWQSLHRLRGFLVARRLGAAVTCFYCLSLWVALPIAAWIGEAWSERILLWFAIAGGVSLVERASSRNAPTYFEDTPVHRQDDSAPGQGGR